jgi:hypothetical protein
MGRQHRRRCRRVLSQPSPGESRAFHLITSAILAGYHSQYRIRADGIFNGPAWVSASCAIDDLAHKRRPCGPAARSPVRRSSPGCTAARGGFSAERVAGLSAGDRRRGCAGLYWRACVDNFPASMFIALQLRSRPRLGHDVDQPAGGHALSPYTRKCSLPVERIMDDRRCSLPFCSDPVDSALQPSVDIPATFHCVFGLPACDLRYNPRQGH